MTDIQHKVLASGPTGGTDQRNRIFSQLTGGDPNLQANAQNLTQRLQGVSTDPGYAAAADQARQNINGDYLAGGPAFQKALGDYTSGVGKVASGIRAQAQSQAADSNARTNSQFAATGQGLSTGNQQAQQATKAASGAQADQTVAQLQNTAQQYVAGQKVGNYQQERARQAAGGAQLDQALGTPLNYLAQVPSATLAPAQQEAALTQQLAGNGFTSTPNSMTVRQPGIWDSLLGGAGAVAGAGGGGGGSY